MGVLASTSEIVESIEEEEEEEEEDRPGEKKKHSIEDDINRLFQAIEARSSGFKDRDRLRRRSAMKKPMRAGFSSGIGISEPVSLKQALRGLCISQASEMAAAKRSPGVSEAGHNIKRLYRAVVVEADGSGLLPMMINQNGKRSFVEVSLVPVENIVGVASTSTTVPINSLNPENPDITGEKTDGAALVSSKDSVMNSENGKATKFSIFGSKKIGKNKADKAIDTDSSSFTSTSEESSLSSGSSSRRRPHMSRDLRWEAINSIKSLSLSHFKLLRRLGCGDIGTVYLAELTGTNALFALKVMDNEFLASRKKMTRAQTEREILQMLDHPFLPTLFAHFVSDKLSCLVMEYCPGGDLHVLRQKQPNRTFSEQAARFYVAEVLVALEYLHMLGVVYRDLKPENILVREDGHIMLSDFDLSLRGAAVNPTVLKPPPLPPIPASISKAYSSSRSCTESPFCLRPCLGPTKPRRARPDLATVDQVSPLPQLVAEPTGAWSNSFVGTHEYLAPEIVKGEGHGSAVDWWTFGVFLFELLYGTTPFKGSGAEGNDEETLSNVVSKGLRFPDGAGAMVSIHARDLIRGLLVKDPAGRLGSERGAAEIKRHPFFDGLNWALVRCAVPPELPKFPDLGSDRTEFEVF